MKSKKLLTSKCDNAKYPFIYFSQLTENYKKCQTSHSLSYCLSKCSCHANQNHNDCSEVQNLIYFDTVYAGVFFSYS